MTQDDIEASPLLLDGILYIGNLSGELVALDAQTGAERWHYTADNSIYGSANWAQIPGSPSKHLFVGSYDNSLHCLDAATGDLIWRYETDNYINGAPATDGRVVIFGGCDELLHAISVQDGTKLGETWAGAYIPGSAALVDGRAYVGHYDNALVCIDIEGQRIVWEYRDNEDGGPFFGSPAVGRDRVVIGSRDEFLHCVDRETGAPLWKFRTRHEIDGSPVIAGDKVVFGSIDGWLYVVSLEEGRRLWSFEIGAAILGCPAVTGGFVVIGAEDGRIYTFGETQ
jgi:outer membrane protein assembly factor BamB